MGARYHEDITSLGLRAIREVPFGALVFKGIFTDRIIYRIKAMDIIDEVGAKPLWLEGGKKRGYGYQVRIFRRL